MSFGEDHEAAEQWWKTYQCAQEALGVARGQTAELLAKQIMFLVEMLRLTFCNAAAACRVTADIQRSIADILAGNEPTTRRPKGMEADGEGQC